MRAVIFSGTTEGRELSRLLAQMGAEVTVCVATAYGLKEQGTCEGVTVLAGRRDAAEMAELLQGKQLCVDATHPYAVEVTRHIRAACEQTGVPYCRLLRPEGSETGGVLVGSAAEAAEYLRGRPGNILLTTGAKELTAFTDLPPERLFPRILPTHEGLAACEAVGIPHRNIVAMQGPFSRELNEAMIRQLKIQHLVTKDGGPAGGFDEKAAAAAAAGVELIVIRRTEEAGEPFEAVLQICKEMMGCK